MVTKPSNLVDTSLLQNTRARRIANFDTTMTDLLVSDEVAMAGNNRLRLELNVLNLFNQKTARHIFNYLNRGAGQPRSSSAINLGNTALDKGYDYNALIRATPDGQNAHDPRYGMEDLFEPGTQGQVSVKFLF